jgi:hypothetical protein
MVAPKHNHFPAVFEKLGHYQANILHAGLSPIYVVAQKHDQISFLVVPVKDGLCDIDCSVGVADEDDRAFLP